MAQASVNPLYKQRCKVYSFNTLLKCTNTQKHAWTNLKEIIKIVSPNVFGTFCQVLKSLLFFSHAPKRLGRNYQSLSSLHFLFFFFPCVLPAPVCPIGTTIQGWKTCQRSHRHFLHKGFSVSVLICDSIVQAHEEVQD